jgi:hypothetical protein
MTHPLDRSIHRFGDFPTVRTVANIGEQGRVVRVVLVLPPKWCLRTVSVSGATSQQRGKSEFSAEQST